MEVHCIGAIAPMQKANLTLAKGRPDQNITDSMKIVQIGIDGNPKRQVIASNISAILSSHFIC